MRIWDTLFSRKRRRAVTRCRPTLETLDRRDVPAIIPLTPLFGVPGPGFSTIPGGFGGFPAGGGIATTQFPSFGPVFTTPPGLGNPAAIIPPVSTPGLTGPLFTTPLPLTDPGTVLPVTAPGFGIATPSPFFGAANNPALSNVVNSLFVGMLGRNADPAGLSSNVFSLSAGTPMITVAQQIANSPEALNLRVTRFYTTFLGRTPEAAGLASNVQLLQTAGERALLTNFLTSPEFLAQTPNNAALVTNLYERLLLRTPSANEVSTLVGALNSGVGLPVVIDSFLVSPEFNTLGLNTAFNTFLARAPDPFAAGAFLPGLQGGVIDSTSLAINLITAPEFAGRFGF